MRWLHLILVFCLLLAPAAPWAGDAHDCSIGMEQGGDAHAGHDMPAHQPDTDTSPASDCACDCADGHACHASAVLPINLAADIPSRAAPARSAKLLPRLSAAINNDIRPPIAFLR